MNHIVWLAHRVNVYEDFGHELDEVIASGAGGLIMGQWTKKWPYWHDSYVGNEETLRAQVDAALSTCDQAGLRVWMATQELSKVNNRQAPNYLPTIKPNPQSLVFQDFKTLSRERGEPVQRNLAPGGRLFFDFECEPWRYYDFNALVKARDPKARIGTIDFFRYGDGEYHKVSYKVLEHGFNHIQFHSLDCEKWRAIFFAGDTDLSVVPMFLREQVPEPEEILREAVDNVYRLRPAGDARHFACTAPDLTDKASLWRGYGVAVDQWKWLESLGHPCLEGWFGIGDEPTSVGYQQAFDGRNAGELFTDHVDEFCRLGKTLTGKDVLIFADPFDPHHNGQQYRRANNPAGGGFANCPSLLRPDIPAIFAVWNEDNAQSLQKSVTYWSESGRRWWLAVYIENNDAQAAAAMIAELPDDKKPEAVMWFTWKMDEITAANLTPKFALFN